MTSEFVIAAIPKEGAEAAPGPHFLNKYGGISPWNGSYGRVSEVRNRKSRMVYADKGAAERMAETYNSNPDCRWTLEVQPLTEGYEVAIAG